MSVNYKKLKYVNLELILRMLAHPDILNLEIISRCMDSLGTNFGVADDSLIELLGPAKSQLADSASNK